MNVYPIIVNNMYVKLYKTHAPGYSQPIKKKKRSYLLRDFIDCILCNFNYLLSLASKQTICMFLLFNCKLMYYQKFVKTIIEDDEKRPDEEEQDVGGGESQLTLTLTLALLQ